MRPSFDSGLIPTILISRYKLAQRATPKIVECSASTMLGIYMVKGIDNWWKESRTVHKKREYLLKRMVKHSTGVITGMHHCRRES